MRQRSFQLTAHMHVHSHNLVLKRDENNNVIRTYIHTLLFQVSLDALKMFCLSWIAFALEKPPVNTL